MRGLPSWFQPRRRHSDWQGPGRLIRAIFPMTSRRGLTEPVISAVADALGARDGYVVKDLFDYDCAPFPNGRSFEVLQVGSCDEVAAEFQRKVTALGYGPTPDRRGILINGEPWKGNAPQAYDALPTLEYTILGPGEQLQGLTIPSGTAGIRMSIARGRILIEGGMEAKRQLRTLFSAYYLIQQRLLSLWKEAR